MDCSPRDSERAVDGAWPSGQRPTWVEIDLDALGANLRTVRQRVGPAVKIMAMVKADAYGHGAIECARRLEAEGADWFGVALPEEGFELRAAGVRAPILSFGGCWAGQERECIAQAIGVVVYQMDMVKALDDAAREAGVSVNVHLKIDTGMGRLGVRYDQAREFIAALESCKNIRVEGVLTHFAAADDPGRVAFTEMQIARFKEVVELLRARGHTPTYIYLANSAATFAHPSVWGDMVRPGAVLYGLWRDVLQPQNVPPPLRPVMSVRSRITLLKPVHRGETLGYGCSFEAPREMLVATLPIGYRDGFVRALSNRGRVIVRGRFAPVVGRVSMDLTMVDVTDVAGVALGDRVTLLGEDGPLSLPVEEIARTAGTISYEIVCGFSRRIPRFYLSQVTE